MWCVHVPMGRDARSLRRLERAAVREEDPSHRRTITISARRDAVGPRQSDNAALWSPLQGVGQQIGHFPTAQA